MKSTVYAYCLAFTVLIVSAISVLICLFAQPQLEELFHLSPNAIISFGDIRFSFTIVIFLACAIVTFFYITFERLKSEQTYYNKNELILLTILTIVVCIANFAMLNLTWQFAFIGLAVLIYEGITLRLNFQKFK